MEWFEALILGLIQGLTEYLPVSSSGHLAIGSALFGIEGEENLAFTIVVHVATVFSTLVILWKEIDWIFKGLFKWQMNEETRYVINILVSMIPIGIVGVFFKDEVEAIFGSGLVINALGNKDLAWQETINWNAGADITTWNNRLNITFDWYKKITDPLLALITTPGSMGVKSVAMNAGQQKTTGIEVTLKVSPIYRPQERINWNISLNGTHAKARYAKIGNAFSSLNEEQKASLAGTTRYYDGGSPTAIWAVRSAGIDPATGQEIFIKKDGSYTYDFSFSDEVKVGTDRPKIEGVFGSSFTYKGFSVNFDFRYRCGGQMFNSSLFNKVENITSAGLNSLTLNVCVPSPLLTMIVCSPSTVISPEYFGKSFYTTFSLSCYSYARTGAACSKTCS